MSHGGGWLDEACIRGQPGWIRRLTRCYCVTQVISGEMGNLVVKVNVKKNVLEGPMMVNARLLEALVSLGKGDSVSDKANGVNRVALGLGWFRVI
jgi:hypothetical protein